MCLFAELVLCTTTGNTNYVYVVRVCAVPRECQCACVCVCVCVCVWCVCVCWRVSCVTHDHEAMIHIRTEYGNHK